MNKGEPEAPAAGFWCTLACLAWALAVVGAYCITYGFSLVQYAREAAGRFPFLARILEGLHLDT